MLAITTYPRRFVTANKRHSVRSLRSAICGQVFQQFSTTIQSPSSQLKKQVHTQSAQVVENIYPNDVQVYLNNNAISTRSNTINTLYAEPEWYTTTPRTPCTDAHFPGLCDGKLHSIPMVNLKTCSRQDVMDYFDNTWAMTDMLFSAFQKKQSFLTPPPHHLRHPMAFYYGHPTVFYVNKFRLAGVLLQGVNEYFESIFEVGVDEMRWDDMNKNTMEWPPLHDVHQYRRQVYQIVQNIIDTHPELNESHAPITEDSALWALFMGMEHERIHLETSSMLMLEHSLEEQQFQMPDKFPPYHPSAITVLSPADSSKITTAISCSSSSISVKWNGFGIDKLPQVNVDYPQNEMVRIPGGQVSIGKKRDFPSYGWDNEYGNKTIRDVEPFYASQFLISNGEFNEFVKQNGYQTQEYWSEIGWEWKCFNNTKHPTFWKQNGPQGSQSNYTLRVLFDYIEMAWDWPVQVNFHEAQAYCQWKNKQEQYKSNSSSNNNNTSVTTSSSACSKTMLQYHLNTEIYHQLMRNTEDRSDYDIEYDAIMDTSSKHDTKNVNFQYSSFCPVHSTKPNQHGVYDTFGNAWEWCEDAFSPLPNFKVHRIYDDFSTPCFDGEHQVIMGGSFISTGANGGSKFSRYHFRPHFMQHASFRLLAQEVDIANSTTTNVKNDKNTIAGTTSIVQSSTVVMPSMDILTSCINAPLPHAKRDPYRHSSRRTLLSTGRWIDIVTTSENRTNWESTSIIRSIEQIVDDAKLTYLKTVASKYSQIQNWETDGMVLPNDESLSPEDIITSKRRKVFVVRGDNVMKGLELVFIKNGYKLVEQSKVPDMQIDIVKDVCRIELVSTSVWVLQ